MSAEVLREAAQAIRERAEVATVGPWEHTYGGIFVGAKTESLGISYECQVVDDDDLNFGEGDADYIASWHPIVAVAVADWLDKIAGEGHDGDGPNGCSDCDPALTVARAYLGVSA